MTRSLILLVAVLLAFGALGNDAAAAPSPGAPAARGSAIGAGEYCADAEEVAFLALLNDYRQQHGLQPVVLTQTLGAAADHHSLEMAGGAPFAHSLADGTSPYDNMTNHGYTAGTYRGENIAGGNAGAHDTFVQWQNSPDHNANMLDPNFAAVGVGRAYGEGSAYKWYWTNVFASVADAPACGAPTPAPPTGEQPTGEPPRAPVAPAPGERFFVGVGCTYDGAAFTACTFTASGDAGTSISALLVPYGVETCAGISSPGAGQFWQGGVRYVVPAGAVASVTITYYGEVAENVASTYDYPLAVGGVAVTATGPSLACVDPGVDPDGVLVSVYNCPTDPLTADPSLPPCVPAVGVELAVLVAGTAAPTAYTDEVGQALIPAAVGTTVSVTQVPGPANEGFEPRDGATASATVPEGVIFVNVLAEIGDTPPSASPSPDPDPSPSAAPSPSAEPSPNGESPPSVGPASSPSALPVPVDPPAGTIRIARFLCTVGAALGTEIFVVHALDPAQPVTAGPECVASDGAFQIEGGEPFALGDDGLLGLPRESGAYTLTDLASGQQATVNVPEGSTVDVVVQQFVPPAAVHPGTNTGPVPDGDPVPDLAPAPEPAPVVDDAAVADPAPVVDEAAAVVDAVADVPAAAAPADASVAAAVTALPSTGTGRTAVADRIGGSAWALVLLFATLGGLVRLSHRRLA